MMLQEENEIYLFRQQQMHAEQELKAAKRERMIQLLSNRRPLVSPGPAGSTKRRSSEPDLLRCSDRVIANATLLSWDDYRRKRSDYLRSVFFRSADNLPNYSRINLTEAALPIVPVRDRSPVRRSSLDVPDHYHVVNSRLNLRIQQLEHQRGSLVHSRSSPSSSSRRSTASQHNEANNRLSHSVASSASSSAYLHRKHKGHEDCCECAYRALSETVTLSRRSGQTNWRPCMVSGRDTLSCSLNSP